MKITNDANYTIFLSKLLGWTIVKSTLFYSILRCLGRGPGRRKRSQNDRKKVNSNDRAICSAIIYSIDENGILDSEIDEIEEILEFKYPKKGILRNLFYVIHDFDPPGIGARDFKEMIAIQTSKMEIKSIYNWFRYCWNRNCKMFMFIRNKKIIY